MNKYYMTYGTCDSMPFIGGWSLVYAESESEARKKHLDRHGLSDSGCLNFAFSYSEDEFIESKMYIEGNHGNFEHEVIE